MAVVRLKEDILDKEAAIEFFADLYGGEHHIPGYRDGVKPFGEGWSVNSAGDLSTFDFNTLTRLVLMAHDRCIRASVLPGGPGKIKIAIWQRQRTGSYSQRHPTLEEALTAWRANHNEAA